MVKAPPRTMFEVFESLPEGTLAQLVNNQLVMEPAPDYPHQDVVTELIRKLGNHVAENNLGKIICSPIDVYFDEGNVYQPDIVFLTIDRLQQVLKAGKLKGPPNLVIEVLSPGTQKIDRTNKKSVYESNGVQEYWLVSPVTKEAIGYNLVNGRYETFFNGTGVLSSTLLNVVVAF